MREITGTISWVYTHDLANSAEFYERVLGLPLDRDAGVARIYRSGTGAYIGLCTAFADRVVEPKGGMITLLTDDVDGWYAEVIKSGGRVKGPPTKTDRFGIYSFFVEDPNGYVIEVQRFL
ncbi:VOC family protein [Shimia biformata]|uniref:VOC family protein n=1 Tax=Shimia biformata TaxID=1294299 RepID=UPI00194E0D1E|nr:VOC family protein [Shimia biformata]